MSEPEAIAGLRKIRTYLLESISQAADEVAAIDSEIERLLSGKRPGAGAV
jgi:plasmid stabilization system protein ParE